ncbi:MAG: riboflavin synthase [Acidimicrobiia bacterium]|nr:riboflavin synthase [Acidimicrobiia bacterium]
MFTGIVAGLGTVVDTRETEMGRQLEIEEPSLLPEMRVGDSVAVNGVCLTAVAVADGRVSVQVVKESLDRSNLGDLHVGGRVDLERPMRADGRFDGHIVQGHVDGVGVVSGLSQEGAAVRMRIELPEGLARYVVEKGSITVDGVSLTVTAVGAELTTWFEIVLIPHTLDVTVLGLRGVGDRVNLEVDVLAKYVERLMTS